VRPSRDGICAPEPERAAYDGGVSDRITDVPRITRLALAALATLAGLATLADLATLAGLVTLAGLGAPPAGAQAKPQAPAQLRRVTIGRSVDRRPITALVLGRDTAPRRLLLVGCIHGNECAGLRIIDALERAGAPAGVQLWLVPQLNPDGTTADTRQNAHGVDLNRNFPFQWQHVTDPTYYAGPRPLSEPETRAAVKLIRRIRPAVTIWYHQHEDLVDMAGGDRGVARRYAQLAHLRATCLAFLPGTAPAWSNHALPGTTAFVVELPAGSVATAALSAHLRAVRAMERGERSGSRSSCAT
jgi:protein MpaA